MVACGCRVRRNQMKKKFLAGLLCLVMIISALACLSACSTDKDKDVEGEILSQTDGAKTLTMWVITENKKNNIDANGNYCYDPAVQAAMDDIEAAFTKETKSRFKTNVDIIYLTEEEYYDKLERAIAANTNFDELVDKAERALAFYLDDRNEKISVGEIEYKTKDQLTRQFYIDYPEYWPYREGATRDTGDAEGTTEEYFINEWGIPELKYPDALEDQVDIIYLSGKERLIKYIENEWLIAVDEDLAGVGALLGDYIAPALLDGIKQNGMTYAIPNNIAIGEYTYMLIDKQMYDSFGYGRGFTASNTLADYGAFLDDVAANKDDVTSVCHNAVGIESSFEETLSHFVYFWEMGYDVTEDDLGNVKYDYPYGDKYNNKLGFSVFGTLYNDPADATRGKISLGFDNLFINSDYQKILKTLKAYDIKGYYGKTSVGEKAAISYMTGGYDIKDEASKNGGVYTDENGRQYYVSVVKYPQVGEEELYGNMLAVSSASKYPYACVQVITALNTDSKLRNILQYGIEGEHYEMDEKTGMLRRLELVYSYEDEDGKTVEVQTKEKYRMDIKKTGNSFVAHPEEGCSADYWENYKQQNGEAVVDPLLGFNFAEFMEESTGTKIDKADVDSLAAMNRIVKGWLDNIGSIEQLDVLLEELKSSFARANYTITGKGNYASVNIEKFTNSAYEDETGEAESPYAVYYKWMASNGYAPAP